MYAIIETGAKQYKVKAGDTLRIEKIDAAVESAIEFDKVLWLDDGTNMTLGQPYIESARVIATVVSHGRGEKIKVLKFKRRKNYLRQQGHRQDYTEVKINDVVAKQKKASKKSADKSA